MTDRGTPKGDREYYSSAPGVFRFHPEPLGQDPFYPTGDQAIRMNLLWDWAESKYDPDDWTVFGKEGDSPFTRWHVLEAKYYNSTDEVPGLPGLAPLKALDAAGLI